MDLKQNITPYDKKNRSRGENWTQEEKDLFFEIMRQSVPIIENKSTDTNTNKLKYLEWIKIKDKLQELTGKPREIAQLKGFWRRVKLSAKKSVSQQKRSLHAAGGDDQPPTPPADDLNILDLCPTDFVAVANMYDSSSDADDAAPQPELESNVEIKKREASMMEEEHELKMKYQRQELAHQQVRHKIELEILMMEKEKKMLELEVIKKNMHL